MIKIQNHCTPQQARQLYDAVKAAGLEYPAIDWAFYISPIMYYYHTERFDRCDEWYVYPARDIPAINEAIFEEKGYDPEYVEPTFIPCPTLAELEALHANMIVKDFDTLIAGIIHAIDSYPKNVKRIWSKLQEESKP